MRIISELNTKEDRKLLFQYLIKLYGKNKANQLMEEHKDNLFGKNSLAYSIGKRSIVFFCLYYLQDYFTPKPDNTIRNLASVHYEIWQELENIFIHNTHDKQQFIMPRGSAKTQIIDTALSVWAHCYKESTYTVVLANTELDAINFVDQTKTALQNEYIKNTFGELVNTKHRTVNRLELELDNDTKIRAYSSFSSVRGTSYTPRKGKKSRPTLFIADDYISESDILTPDSKEKKYIKFQKEIEEGGDDPVIRNGKLIQPGTRYIVLGTPLAKGDFIDKIKSDPTYKTFHRSVVNFDMDAYFENHPYWQKFREIFLDNTRNNPLFDATNYYYDNKDEMEFPTIWEKYSCLELAKKYINKRSVFMQELMCDVNSVGDTWFKSNRIMPDSDLNENNFTKTMLAIDTAGVKNKDVKRSDYFAFVVGSLSDNNFKYVRKAQLRRINDFHVYTNYVINLLHEFTDISHVYIEKNTFNGSDVDTIVNEIEKNHPDLKKRNITFINEMQKSNKDDKISTIVSDVNNGRIIFSQEKTEKDFLDQVMNFQGQQYSLHDDAPDCLTEFSNRIEKIEVKKNIKTIPRHWLF